MKEIRIIVLFGNVPLYGNERINIETLYQLQQRGAQVRFLIREEWTKQTIQSELQRRGLEFKCVPYFDTLQRGIGLRTWWRNIRGILAGSWALLREVRSFRATHIHVGSSAWILNFLPALILSRRPLVFRAGDVPALHHLLWRWVWIYTRRRASIFVCDSYFVRNQLVSIGAPAARCSVIYAPAPQREERPLNSPFDVSVALGTDVLPIFLYVGQISRNKGIDKLVDVAVELAQQGLCRFIIAGDYRWRNPLGESLVAKVHKLGLGDQIKFTGYVEDIESLYAISQIHLAPSVWDEPYGLTVIEAKMRSIPSIVFPSGGLKELVQHKVDGWVCKESSVDALRAAIKHYLATPADIKVHGMAAQLSLFERLQVQNYGDKWQEAYESSRICY